MISKLGQRLAGISERWVPDPFVFALGLTLLTFVIALAIGEEIQSLSLVEGMKVLGTGWYGEFYGTGLMKFALQMCIVLITGHALAMTRPVSWIIEKVTRLASTPAAAAAVVALVACLASLVQWGLGAIAGAFMAREMGRRFAREGRAIHYPLLGAAGYAGFMVWHGGFSGTAPLKVAEPGHFLESTLGVIPITETLFSGLNLMLVGTLLVVIPTTFWLLMPRNEDDMVPFQGPLEPELPDVDEDRRRNWIGVLESTRLLSGFAAVAILIWLVAFFAEKGAAGWNLDSINLTFLALGLLLHRSPAAYASAVIDGVKGCGGIILQFPFYFGILGLLKSSGLIVQVAQFFIDHSTETTFPLLTFLSAALVNFFVPSGGGQWAVQGPVMMQAIGELGVPAYKAILALSYGDAWTNMLQPFWALPLLGIMGLRARDIIGYTAFLMAITGPLMLAIFFIG